MSERNVRNKQVRPKLVRDGIPELMREEGERPIIRVLTDDKEYLQALNEKLFEEVKEYEEGFSIEELADVVEVVEALLELLQKVAPGELRKAREEKRTNKGGFTQRYYLTGTFKRQ